MSRPDTITIAHSRIDKAPDNLAPNGVVAAESHSTTEF
jgi:hypothetical protein